MLRTKMITELSSFQNAFPSELFLIKSIAELLRRMGRESVQILHGTQEYGKDIIFYARGGFKEKRLYSCVIKNTKLTGNISSNSGTRTVFLQAETAFDTPFINSKGISENVEVVYVITPYECSPASLSSIKSKLQSRNGQIRFLCGPKLLDLFLNFWPDFIMFESGTLSNYLSNLPERFSNDTAFASLVRRYPLLADTVKSITDVYVQRDFKEALLNYSIDKINWPSKTILDKPIGLTEVNETIKKLFNVESLLRLSNPEIEETFRKEIEIFENDIKAFWIVCFKNYKESFKKRKKDSKGFSKYVLPESKVKLKLNESRSLVKNYKELHRQYQIFFNDAKKSFNIGSKFSLIFEKIKAKERTKYENTYRNIQNIACFIPTKIETNITSNYIDFNKDFLDSGLRSILVTGPAGFGKTCFCKWHALKDAKEYMEGIAFNLPIFIQLHSIYPNDDDNFENAFIQRTDLRKIFTEKSKKRKKKTRIFLDGLDEVAEVERQKRLMLLAWKFYIKNNNVQIIVTAREHVSGEWLNWLRRIKIADLSDTQVKELVSNWLDKDEGRINEFYQQIEKLPSLLRIMRVPLLGTLVLAVYRRTKSLPQNRHQLYALFVELHCGGWDIVKNVRRGSRFGAHDKELVLSRFAGWLHYNEKRDGENSDFYKCVKEIFPGFSDIWNELLEEIIQDGLLLSTGSKLIFSHLSFQEFLAARSLAEPQGVRASTILNTYLRGNEWWKEVISFYICMMPRPNEILRWIKKHRDQIIKEVGYDGEQLVDIRYKYLIDSINNTFQRVIETS